MAGIFGESFVVSVYHETKHENSSESLGKIRSKIWGKIQDDNRRKSRNFCSATSGTLVNVTDLRRNSDEYQGGSPECEAVGSPPKLAKLHQASPKFA